MTNFSQFLYLPSGGLSYSPFVFVRPITVKSSLLEVDPFTTHSSFEHIITLVNEYVTFETNILDIYVQDIYYIWLHYLNTDFQSELSDFRKVLVPCRKCFQENKVLVDYSDVDVFLNDRFKASKLKERHCIKIGKIEITLPYRKVSQNVEFANLILTNTDSYDVILRMIYYILTQTEKMSYEKQEIDSREWYDVIANENIGTIVKIYNKILNLEMDFGVYNKLSFKCYSCGSEEETILFNNFYLSQMSESRNKNILAEQESTFDYLMNFSRLPIFSFDEITQLPLRFRESIMKSVGKIKFHAGVVL